MIRGGRARALDVVPGALRIASAAADFTARHQHRRPDEVARQIVDELKAMLVH